MYKEEGKGGLRPASEWPVVQVEANGVALPRPEGRLMLMQAHRPTGGNDSEAPRRAKGYDGEEIPCGCNVRAMPLELKKRYFVLPLDGPKRSSLSLSWIEIT